MNNWPSARLAHRGARRRRCATAIQMLHWWKKNPQLFEQHWELAVQVAPSSPHVVTTHNLPVLPL